jgi:hypothetical protein
MGVWVRLLLVLVFTDSIFCPSLHGCCQRFFGVDYVASDQKTVWFSCSGSICNNTRCLVQHQPSWRAQSFCWNSEIGTLEANSYSSDGVQATCSCDSGCQGLLILSSLQHLRYFLLSWTNIHRLSLSLSLVCNPWLLQVWEILQPSSHKRAFILHRRACYWCSFLIFLDACLGPWKVGKTIWRIWQTHWQTLLCILPFEVALFEAHGIRTTSFRHPVLEDAFTSVAVFTSLYLNPLSSVVNTQT